MCGRFTLRTPPNDWIGQFGLSSPPSHWEPRYNIAPTQWLWAVRRTAGQDRELAVLRWGLVPSWSRDMGVGARMINARGETVAEKPSFRTPFRRRRCLIVADGYYEWKKIGRRKQPFHIHRPGHEPFAFAGIWERAGAAGEEGLETCSIITTAARPEMRELHDRMPLILEPVDYSPWLDTPEQDWESLLPLLAPYEGELHCDPVSMRVNNVRNDDPACLDSGESAGE